MHKLGLRLWLNQKTYGEVGYAIEVKEIEIKKYSFRPCEGEFCAGGVDLDALKKYGFAVMVAEVFRTQKNFLLTKEGNLLCGKSHGLLVIKEIIRTKIVIDRNLGFLTGTLMRMNEDSNEDRGLKFLTRCLGMKDGCAVASVKIPDFFSPKKDQIIEPGPYSLTFLGDPVEVS